MNKSTREKVAKVLHYMNKLEYWKHTRKTTYSDYELERAYHYLDYLPEKIENLISELSVLEKEALELELKLQSI